MNATTNTTEARAALASDKESVTKEITSNGTNAASKAAVAACATEWAAYEQAVGTPEAQAAYSAYSAKWAQVTGNGPVTKEVR